MRRMVKSADQIGIFLAKTSKDNTRYEFTVEDSNLPASLSRVEISYPGATTNYRSCSSNDLLTNKEQWCSSDVASQVSHC